MHRLSLPNVKDDQPEPRDAHRIRMGNVNINTIPSDTEVIYKDLIRRARKEIMLLLPSERAFLRQQEMGVIQVLVQLANEKGIKVRVLAPTVSTELQNDIMLLREQNVEVRLIKVPNAAEEEAYRTLILTVDEQASIVIELKDDTKETFAEGIGISVSSTNKANVQSYVTLFRSIWQETELREKLFSKTIQLQKATESLGDMTRDLQGTAKTLSVAEAHLVVSEKKLASEREKLGVSDLALSVAKSDLEASDKKLEAQSEKIKASEVALSDAQDAIRVQTEKLERSQNELAQSEKNIKMRTEELRVSEFALLDSNQKLARMTEDLEIAIKDLAALKKTSDAKLGSD